MKKNDEFLYHVFPSLKPHNNSLPDRLKEGYVMLLEYCTYGSCPKPEREYPKMFSLTYQIKNVNQALSGLEKNGCITLQKKDPSKMTVAQLSKILFFLGCDTSGKKADLVTRVRSASAEDRISEELWASAYVLTERGTAILKKYLVQI